ncbi:MAG TPA: hypothetical protein VNC40_04915 [Gaiellaceae bacterium]|nr:hypothetical protein [Gaiellaceae bacterium]
MKWALGVMLAALAATVTINVLLLGYGGTHNDPVGQLSPVANLPLRPLVGPTAPSGTTPNRGSREPRAASADD